MSRQGNQSHFLQCVKNSQVEQARFLIYTFSSDACSLSSKCKPPSASYLQVLIFSRTFLLLIFPILRKILNKKKMVKKWREENPALHYAAQALSEKPRRLTGFQNCYFQASPSPLKASCHYPVVPFRTPFKISLIFLQCNFFPASLCWSIKSNTYTHRTYGCLPRFRSCAALQGYTRRVYLYAQMYFRQLALICRKRSSLISLTYAV